MKVIDLLNKIANGEEVPKKVKYKTHYWEYKEEAKDYKDNEDDYVFSCSNYDITAMLDNEVEIIEEDKKIEELKYWVDVASWVEGEDLKKGLKEQAEFNKNLYCKINEIIDKLNAGVDKE